MSVTSVRDKSVQQHLLFAKNDEMISDLCKSLATEFLLIDEGDIKGFLGIQIDHRLESDGSITITMSQPGQK
jgi:hypothetical protein